MARKGRGLQVGQPRSKSSKKAWGLDRRILRAARFTGSSAVLPFNLSPPQSLIVKG